MKTIWRQAFCGILLLPFLFCQSPKSEEAKLQETLRLLLFVEKPSEPIIMEYSFSSTTSSTSFEWTEDYISRLSRGDCQAISSGDAFYCDTKDCKGIVRKNSSYCQTNDCKGVATGNSAYCKTKLCKAWSRYNSNYCSGSVGYKDCMGVSKMNRSYCQSKNCIAITRRDRFYCP